MSQIIESRKQDHSCQHCYIFLYLLCCTCQDRPDCRFSDPICQQICNRVAVLDEGRIQETGPVSEVFSHPQTRAAKRLVLARMQDADAPCVKLELPEDDKELAALMAYVKAHNLKVLEGEEHV